MITHIDSLLYQVDRHNLPAWKRNALIDALLELRRKQHARLATLPD